MIMKALQGAKIREIGEALIDSGFRALDAQANALGLQRSTTWTILKGCHKNSGLSATTIIRMLTSPSLPSLVRIKVLEYVYEKLAGLYGDSPMQLRKFRTRLDGLPADDNKKRMVSGGRSN
jgi:hypothetical protein